MPTLTFRREAQTTERGRTLTAQQLNEGGLTIALVLLVIVLAVTTDSFATVSNMWNILGDAALVGIVAWAGTLVIVAGEIDISVGPAVAFWGVMLAKMAGPWGFPLPLAVLLTLIGGLLVGAAAGWLRGRFGVPSFIVTLGLWSSLRGLAQFMTDALPVPIKPNGLLDVLGGKIGPIPTAALVMFLLFAVFVFVARATTYGRSVYAVGGNARAANLSGINVLKIRVILFATSGLMAALLGIVVAGRLASGNSGAASGLEFSVIAAVVVGGTALQGGRGSMLGTLLGVLFIAVIGNGLVLLGVNSFFQDVVRGLLIVAAVLVNTVLGNRTGRRGD
ncbi:ABC transporter permease [Phycicoccus sp. Soil802]|uniref:ABC transporter permease n=1 Tax=Phycicoccus sp. Soil802 TaxID=1736414 RepID=UPI000702CC63|nr:ABC transporter permease [Phycicoccus sp. Soil802]KRF22352.1 sugar ABC transporter permease [Phycicoccus sp. Soil802]